MVGLFQETKIHEYTHLIWVGLLGSIRWILGIEINLDELYKYKVPNIIPLASPR